MAGGGRAVTLGEEVKCETRTAVSHEELILTSVGAAVSRIFGVRGVRIACWCWDGTGAILVYRFVCGI